MAPAKSLICLDANEVWSAGPRNSQLYGPKFTTGRYFCHPEFKGDVWADMKRTARILAENTPIDELSLDITDSPAPTAPQPENALLF